jgi:hypothetical protein
VAQRTTSAPVTLAALRKSSTRTRPRDRGCIVRFYDDASSLRARPRAGAIQQSASRSRSLASRQRAHRRPASRAL